MYEVQKREAQGPISRLDDVVLVTIAAGGATTREALASALGASLADVSDSIERLVAAQQITFGAAGYEGSPQMEIVLLSPAGERAIGQLLKRARARRPERWTAYMAVQEGEQHALLSSAERLFGRDRVGLIPATTRRDMVLPELAITFDVSDEVELFNAAARAWEEVRASADLPLAPIQMTAYSAPRIRSSVIEAFAQGATSVLRQQEAQIMGLAAHARPNADERELAVRAMTEAAWALRRAVGQAKPPSKLADSEAAFAELQPVSGMHLDAPRERIQRPLIEALERATDRLGPIPGGRLAGFSSEPGRPNIVEPVAPSLDDLVAIARAAGVAVGHAEKTTGGEVKAISVIEVIARGR
ncbi:MAG: hypothetical protein ACLPZR_31730 [Solirubrobacteraceae bacterium]